MTFAENVLALFSGNIIGYWKMDETSGAVAVDSSPEGNNGAYTGVTLNNGAFPAAIGGSAPLFDGANDFNNIYSAGFIADFNGSAGTVIALAKVSGAGVWTDATVRYVFRAAVDGDNYVYLRKNNADNRLDFGYESGNSLKLVTLTATNPTWWVQIGITWDAAAGTTGEVKAYYNGSQTGATAESLGAWVGNPDANATAIGTVSTAVPANVWDGWIGHAIFLDRAATPTEMSTLYGYTGL